MPVSPQPPRFARWILQCFLSTNAEGVLGDLEEEYIDHVEMYGPFSARLLYVRHVFASLPHFFLESLHWTLLMFKNYLKISFRTLWRYKGFSTLNILGLATGIAFCLLLILLIQSQKEIDRHHAHAERIYRVITEVNLEQVGVIPMASSPAPLGEMAMLSCNGKE